MNVRPSNKTGRVIRISHPKGMGWCHMFDVKLEAFNLWKSGGIPLKAEGAIMPDGTVPNFGTQIACGTCETTHFKFKELAMVPLP